MLSIDGTFEAYLKNVIFIFGFQDYTSNLRITKEEVHFYLDCTMRGVMNLVIPPKRIQGAVERKRFREKQAAQYFTYLGKRLDQNSIKIIVDEMFGTQQKSMDINELLSTFQK